MVNFNLRLPCDLHARLKKAAAEDKRSIHAEILWLIEHGLDEAEAARAPGLTAGPGLTPP